MEKILKANITLQYFLKLANAKREAQPQQETLTLRDQFRECWACQVFRCAELNVQHTG